MDDHQRAISHVVERIAEELKRSELWEDERPSPERLASGQPFCYDTLDFHQWLQWLFLPRMRRILAAGGEGMPARSAIHPYADECLGHVEQNTDVLLALIRQFDELITDGAPHGTVTLH